MTILFLAPFRVGVKQKKFRTTISQILFLPQFSPALKGVEAKAYAQIEK
jgi:hypothetical protein